MEAFIIPFLTILVAEFLDKSQISILLLGTKTKKHWLLLAGVMLAFVVVDGLAIIFGEVLTAFIPSYVLKIVSGLLFILFGILSLKQNPEAEEKSSKLYHPFVSGFAVVFFSEWGDKTQLAAAVFATQYPPLPVFFGVMAAMFVLSLTALFISHALRTYTKARTIHMVSGIVFIILGLLFLFF